MKDKTNLTNVRAAIQALLNVKCPASTSGYMGIKEVCEPEKKQSP